MRNAFGWDERPALDDSVWADGRPRRHIPSPV